MARINLYAQNKHAVLVDGVPLSAFAEGDYMQVKLDGGGATRTHGGDGPAMNQTVEQGGQITINLLPTSPALGMMYEIRKSQNKNPRLFSIILTTGVDEMITAGGCAFADLPQFASGGQTMRERQFVFECLSIKLDTSDVEAIAGGLIGGLL